MTSDIKIFRVILEVSDLSKGSHFYSKLLGSEGRSVGGGRYYFDCGSVILALLDSPQTQIIPQYVYFAVSNLEEIHSKAVELNCLLPGILHGSPAGEIVIRPWGERSFYARDPYGNGLCFVDDNTLFTGLEK